MGTATVREAGILVTVLPIDCPYPTMTVDEIKALDVVFPCGRGLSLDNKRLLAPGPRRDGRMLAL
jgi:hypothetical protein